jgi:V8-like Glu-specific endopeptidase
MKIDLQRVHGVIVDSFQLAEFRRLLNYRFEIDLEDEVGNVGFSEAVERMLDLAKDRGILPELIAEIALKRPKRPDVQAVYRAYAAELVSEVKKAEIDARVKEAYAKFFGDNPPVDLQSAGHSEATVPTRDAGLERTLRTDLGYLDVAQWSELLACQSGRICRVELNDARGTMGTGFLVGPDTLLTNYHVVEAVIDGAHAAELVQFRFDFKTRLDGTVSEGTPIGLATPSDRAVWLLGHARYAPGEKAGTPDAPPPNPDELDYALVRLARKIGDEPIAAGGTKRGWIEVPQAQPALSGLPLLMILQHPNREPQKLAFDTRPSIELKHDGLRVRYATNTEWGSSGSPCFDKNWALLALHHYGDPAFDHPKYNQGVPIGLIRAHLGELAGSVLGGRCL